ncbi:hypothetical protein MKO06_03575 [Gramella sp. GC03-9]|uniref:Uncharacterized protein n=1 Tax=Christiangramia oceanisediminis TaxID=2920386 RepID=A0A9X2KW08_9FLAO|nr:hypothetical protein [Gramella oceanisediminis]MCP9198973.1 hypothetical protein [Gramella oceanisediminis]
MRTNILVLMLIMMGITGCDAQETKGTAAVQDQVEKENIPKGNWKVNREYDENGNLISYDSTYVYSYSTINGDTVQPQDMDEIFKDFSRFFKNEYQMGPSAFMGSFLNDSIRGNRDFFEKDFFSDRMMSEHFREQVRMMDSIRNQFLKQHYPGIYFEDQKKIIPREKTTTENGTI